MSRQPVIAVTQRIDDYPDRGERRDALDQALLRWLTDAGFTGLPVANSWTGAQLSDWLAMVDPLGVVLSGGNDIGTCADRDAVERHLIAWALDNRRPLLGICRGMQMLAVAAGGQLKQVSGHVRTRHQLDAPFGDVNSYHDSALTGCPTGYVVLARSADGEIEAMRHTTHPVVGWMWHPERERPFDPGHLELARAHFHQTAVETP